MTYLKQRGVLLGLISKNDEGRVRDLWAAIVGKLFPLEWFAVRKINWRLPKIENMKELLGQVNLLPRSVCYVDDNPVERATMAEGFPGIRVLDGYHLYWRKTLLWAPETQVAHITAKSVQRTEMIQAQIERDQLKATLTIEEFRAQQGMSVHIRRITAAHAASARAFELLNKTNQFNYHWPTLDTGGDSDAFAERASVWIVHAEDRYTSYGVIAVILIDGSVAIKQIVMSCRVLGHEVEIAALSSIISHIQSWEIIAETRATEHNLLSQNLFYLMGFQQDGPLWRLHGPPRACPSHIQVELCDGKLPEPTMNAA